MTTTINVDKRSVKDLLETGKNKKFVIPEYQRPYITCWAVYHCGRSNWEFIRYFSWRYQIDL